MEADPLEVVAERAKTARQARSDLLDAILDARAAGKSLAEIGEAVQLSKQRIHQMIREEGDDA